MEKKKDPFDLLNMLDLSIFPFAQQIIIAFLTEEIRWLKKRVAQLERQKERGDVDECA